MSDRDRGHAAVTRVGWADVPPEPDLEAGGMGTTILIGVDESTRSEDAVAFGCRLAGAGSGPVIVACVFAYSDVPSRASNKTYRQALKTDAVRTARRMAESLRNIAPDRIETETVADPSPARALHDLAEARHAAIVVVGSTHTHRAGRVLPGATAERMLHDAPCAVAVVPDGYRNHAHAVIRRIGVAYDGGDESKTALAAAADAARALRAELELIAVVPADDGGRADVQRELEAAAAAAGGVRAEAVLLAGDPASRLAIHSQGLDMLVLGSRGRGPLRAVLTGGVSGRVVREARCPVIVVPRGVEAPLADLFRTAPPSDRFAAPARDRSRSTTRELP